MWRFYFQPNESVKTKCMHKKIPRSIGGFLFQVTTYN